jgi:hypothetical protein
MLQWAGCFSQDELHKTMVVIFPHSRCLYE